MNKLKFLLSIVGILLLTNLSAQTKKSPPPPVVVDKKGHVKLYGKDVAFDDLKKELQAILVKKATIPNDIPIKFDPEILMGTRSEVRQQVAEAIAGAKWAKKAAAAAQKTAAYTVTVNRKGEIFLDKKKVPLEQLKKALQAVLVKMSALPAEVPVKFDEEILMGTRGEVRGEVDGAMKGATWLRKKAALQVVRAYVAKKLAVPAELNVAEYKTSGNYAFIMATPTLKDGKAIDYSKTPVASAYKNGVYGEDVFALLKNEGGKWRLVTCSMGATDVAFGCWWKTHKAPKDLFNPEMLSEKCQ